MLYDISLEISYEFSYPGDAGRHVLRMQPLNLPGEQRVIASTLVIKPDPSEYTVHRDFFGNEFIEIDFNGTLEEILFTARARVERELIEVPWDQSPGRAELQVQLESMTDLGSYSPLHYLAASPYIPLHDAISQYAAGYMMNNQSVMESARQFGEAIFESMKYDPEATDVDTPVLEAFNERHGVCQDYSHIMIAGLRGVGIPAGYVSGFLRTNVPQGEPILEGADAMHAWVRVWCGQDMGWVEYDPTNRMFATRDHVVIARGRDYGDVSPVKGLVRMSGGLTSEQRVTVKLLNQ